MITIEEWEKKQTEAYAYQKEKEEEMWHDHYDALEQQYIKDIDALLHIKNNGFLEKLTAYSENESLRTTFQSRPMFVSFFIMMEIVQQELAHTKKATVLSHINSMQDITVYMREFRFQLWRFELHIISDHTSLYNYIQSVSMTPCVLGLLTVVSAIDPPKTLLSLVDYMLDMKQINYAIDLLDLAHSIYPTDSLISVTWDSIRKMFESEGL